MLFSLDDLNAELGHDLLAKGRLVGESGGLEQPNIQHGGELITALIRTGRAPLRIYVRVREQPGGGVKIQGECTCSTRRNCLHVAAALLKALEWEQPGATAAQRRRRKSQRGKKPTAAPETAVTLDLPRLVYVLSPPEGLEQGIRVDIYAVRENGASSHGEVRRYAPAWASRGVPPRFLSAEDLEILRCLESSTRGSQATVSLTEDAVLNRILETGRCRAGELAGPVLRAGSQRSACLNWRMREDGSQSLEWVADAEGIRVLHLDGLWYLDAEEGACGPLETGLTLPLIRELNALSPLAPERARQARADVMHRFPREDFPLPAALDVDLLSPIEPVPCLVLESRPLQAVHDSPSVHLLRLDFEYHGRRLHRADALSRVEGQRVLRVQRNKNGERRCFERLSGLGFRPDRTWSGETGSDCFLLSEHPDDWLNFQYQSVPVLLKAGWRVEFQGNFSFRLARVRDWHAELNELEDHGWFGVAIGVDTEAGRVNLLPALVKLIQEAPEEFTRERLLERQLPVPVPLPDGRLLPVPPERLRLILETLFELHDPDSLDPDGRLRLSRFQLARLAELDDDAEPGRLDWRGADEFRRMAERLRRLSGIEAVEPPVGLGVALRGYQRQGLDWLQFLRREDLAGVLADDMGLGKTVQALAHVLVEKEHGRLDRPVLVVAPTSLMPNWRREAERFAPTLRVLTLHGPGRHALFEEIDAHDLVLTTYPLLARDRDLIMRRAFHLLILDEAQVVKNPKARASRVVRELRARHRLCLTGTPMENHLGELWSLFDFLLPGLLGTAGQFGRLFRSPIEKQGDSTLAQRLARRVRPFLLRRTKTAVVAELPPKTEILRGVELDGKQRDLYESIRLAMHERVRREVENKGLGRSSIVILDSLLKLRQVCCDPRLVKLDSARGVRESAKLELLMTLLPEMLEEGRRILLFSQFTSMLELIGQALRGEGLEYVKLTGASRDRALPVERFQRGEVPLFLISLKAGGVGLNLTAADTVIHYDPWWNPAVERQATDRAHRIGQNKPVFVYKLFAEGTVEERIQALQARKQALADGLYNAGGPDGPQWSGEDLDYLFEPLH